MPQPRDLSLAEFIILLALMVSLVALSIDAMLPVLDRIGIELGATHANDAQHVVTALFVGFAAGQLVVGPLSDSFGRKPVIYAGYVVFVAGCLLSIFATSFTWMLIGRVLQGLGAASPRIVTISIVRDLHEGRAMARVMSMIQAVFILVPTIAPAIGQGIDVIAGWRAIFWVFLGLAIVTGLWFGFRQRETLDSDARRPFSLRGVADGVAQACSNRFVLGYTVATGLISGAFIAYLGTAQQIFQTTYDTGAYFPLYFAIASIAIGCASVLNATLVVRLGMRLLSFVALIVVAIVSAAFLYPVANTAGAPPLWQFMAWLMVSVFAVGILFSNLMSLAMQPMGHMAGLGAALVGSLSTFIALPFSWAIGASFDGGVMPLVAGFAGLGAASLVVMLWTERMKPLGSGQ